MSFNPFDPPDAAERVADFDPFNPDAYDDTPAPPVSPPASPPMAPRPISDKQLAANRANAQKSTGPKTEAGKARSMFSGLKHGLYARDVVLPGEDTAAYDAMLADLCAALEPHGRAEEDLVRRAADMSWRLGRSASIEAGLLNPDWSRDPRAEWVGTREGPLIDGFRIALDETKTLDQLGRYEARLERGLQRTLDILYRLQATRRRVAAMQDGVKNPAIENKR